MTEDIDTVDYGNAQYNDVDLDFVPYEGPEGVAAENEEGNLVDEYEYSDFFDDADARLYWELQQTLVSDTIVQLPEAVHARPNSFPQNRKALFRTRVRVC